MRCLVVSADSPYKLTTDINKFLKNYNVIDYQVVYKAGEDIVTNQWYAFLKVEDGR